MKDLHTHTTFSDGKNTPEEMVQAAIRAGLTEYGISDHGYTPFDESYCMPQSRYGEYLAVLAGLREKYKGQISLRLGMEQDIYSVPAPQGLDYVIGSVHYLLTAGILIGICLCNTHYITKLSDAVDISGVLKGV